MSRRIDRHVRPLLDAMMENRAVILARGTTAQRRSRRWRRLQRFMAWQSHGQLDLFMRLGQYIETPNGGVRRVNTKRWIEWLSTEPNKHVAEDFVGPYRVSTVFLGIDHGYPGPRPVLYETMVFRGWADRACERYCTREEARLGHEAMLARVRAGEFDKAFSDEEEGDRA